MKIFLSHGRKDSALASQLARRLRDREFTVWLSEEEIGPRDNWAKKLGKALDDSDLMVLLFTPTAAESDRLQQDFEYAIMSRKYEHRVFSVFVGPKPQARKVMPWLLLKLPHRQVRSASEFGKVVKDIEARCTELGMSPSHA